MILIPKISSISFLLFDFEKLLCIHKFIFFLTVGMIIYEKEEEEEVDNIIDRCNFLYFVFFGWEKQKTKFTEKGEKKKVKCQFNSIQFKLS